ncbi:hypothetical protein ACUXCC_004650 [Cytobacillus horneckiae]
MTSISYVASDSAFHLNSKDGPYQVSMDHPRYSRNILIIYQR